jgi:hypothetical protein
LYYNNNNRLILAFYPNRTFTAKFKAERLIMVGSGGSILTPSGVKKVGTNTWYAISYGNGVYVAIGSDTQNGYITRSIDGINWTSPKKIIYTSLRAICFGNGKFIVGDAAGYAITSTDGINWTIAQTMKMTPEGIAYGNGRFVACGSITTGVGSNGYATSTNGTDWIATTNNENWNDVAYGNNIFFVIGKYAYLELTNEGKFKSKKGLNTITWNDLVYGGGKFVSVGNGGAIGKYEPASSRLPRYFNVGTNDWKTVIYDENKFIACGNNYITYSSDGINWTSPERIKDISGNVITFGVYGICAIP